MVELSTVSSETKTDLGTVDYINPELSKYAQLVQSMQIVAKRFIVENGNVVWDQFSGCWYIRSKSVVFQPLSEVELQNRLSRFLKRFDAFDFLSEARINQIIFHLKNLTYQNLKPQSGIVFTNGFYDTQTRTFSNVIPQDQLLLWSFPFEYQPGLQLTPRLRDWLGILLNKDANYEEIIRLLFGQSFGLASEFNVIFFFAGEAGSGKSTLFNVIACLIGIENVTGISIRSWDKFSTANVATQRLVTFSDIGSQAWHQEYFLETLKTLSGRDPLTLRMMFTQGTSKAVFKEAVTVTSNYTTVLTGDSGIRRRLLPVYMTTVPTDPIPNYVQQLVVDAPALVSWVLDISNEMLENPWGFLGLKTENLQQDPLLDFFKSRVEFKKGNFLAFRTLYGSFRQFCLNEGYGESDIVKLPTFNNNIESLASRLAREKKFTHFGKALLCSNGWALYLNLFYSLSG